MSKQQRTLKGEASISGVGLHTGNTSTLTIKPAPENSGFRFVRTDMAGEPEIPAVVDFVVSLERGTTISQNGATVHTVEHVLAALVGMNIDNARLELTNNEPPVGDGSSLPFVEMIKSAGIVEQSALRNELIITDTIRYTDEKRGTEIVALPNPEYRVTVMVDYNNPVLGSQHTGLFNLDEEFEKEFAPARTFCFLHEVEMLFDHGLIKGGNLDNAIVIVDEDLTDEELQRKLKKTWHIRWSIPWLSGVS
ncbi:MAG: UDP-3-O-(3-hydroxymyristoyl) N-acetylglucosamine deacetylase [Chlorobi bacterium OLB6]|nr:MAG: UDP-3-O-(3-hydroxymyristoyl) N-acetylglucosamine deacetylase [Chlorobi bacterium OLB6]